MKIRKLQKNKFLWISGSGLDPHISLQAALVQIPRISQSSKITKEELEKSFKKILSLNFRDFWGRKG